MITEYFIRLFKGVIDNISDNLRYHNCYKDLLYDELDNFFDLLLSSIVRTIELALQVYQEYKGALSSYYVYSTLCKINEALQMNREDDMMVSEHILKEIKVKEESIDYGKYNHEIVSMTSLNAPRVFIHDESRTLSKGSEKIIMSITEYVLENKEKGFTVLVLFALYSYYLCIKATHRVESSVVNISTELLEDISQYAVQLMFLNRDKYNYIIDVVEKKFRKSRFR